MTRISTTKAAVLLLTIVAGLSVLACGESPSPAVATPSVAGQPGGGQTGVQTEADGQLDRPAPTGVAATQAAPTPRVPSGRPEPSKVVTMTIQPSYVTTRSLDDAPDGSSDDLAKLVAHSTIIAIGTTADGDPREERVPGRLTSDPSKPDPNFTMVGNVYEVHVERYLKGEGNAILPVIQPTGHDAIIPGPGNSPGRLTQGRDASPELLMARNSRYVLFLRENDHAPGLWMGTAHPYKFLLEDDMARVESPVGGLDGAFPDRSEAELVSLIESFMASNRVGQAPKIAELETPDGSNWELELVDGSPLIDDTFVLLTIRGDEYGEFDGCNRFGGRTGDGTPIARPDGTFSAPGVSRTEMLCEGPEGVMEQADAFVEALMAGEGFRLERDRLEIIDGSGDVRLVLIRQEPLPGQPVDLAGTAWQLVADEDGGSDVRVPTLAFLTDHIAAGLTGCRGYVVEYSASGGRVRFPGTSMTGPIESCTNYLLRIEGSYTDHFTWAREYSVDESTGERLLRIRTSRGRTLLFQPLLSATDSISTGRWSLTTLVEPHRTDYTTVHSRTSDVVPGTEVTIDFSEYGVSGSAGCNSYGAPLSVQNSSMTIGAVTVTRAWCDDPERLMDQEQRYLDILTHVTHFHIHGNRLALLTNEDKALLFTSLVHSSPERVESGPVAAPASSPSSTPTSAPISQASTTEVSEALLQDARHYAADVGVDLDEAVRRLRAQRTIGELGAELETNEQPTFGGLWIQHTPEYKVIVAFTRDGEETVRLYVEGTSLADMIELREVEATLVELREAQGEAGIILRQLGIRAASGIDITSNVVELYLSEEEKEELDAGLKKSGLELPDRVKIVF